MANPIPGTAGDRAKSRDFGRLVDILRFIQPYRWAAIGATLALLVAAGTVLALGPGLKFLIDQGFGEGDPSVLNKAVLVLFGVAVLLAGGTAARFYLVSWIGERVVADMRRAVFDHIIGLSPGFFEVTRTGEVISRLTTDTTLIQQVVSSSVSVALRNSVLMVGGVIGAQFGARAGQNMRGERLRLLLGLLVLAVGLRFAFQLVVQPDDLYSIRMLGAE